jgi:p-cumate 2,3-dioxygenase alpha subunit
MNAAAEKYPENFNDDGRYNLRRVERLEHYRGFYFVNFDPNAVPLAEYLAGAGEILDLIADQAEDGLELIGHPHEYAIPANYKNHAENSFDGYHGNRTHVSYFEFLEGQLGDSEQQAFLDEILKDYSKGGTGAGLGNGHGIFESWLPNGRPGLSWIPPWGPEAKVGIDRNRAAIQARVGEARMKRICDHAKNLVIFPNLVINDHVAITIRSFQPEAYDRMRVTAWAMGPKNEDALMRKLRLDNFLTFLGPAGFATPDDNEMLQLAQRGAAHTPVEWIDFSRDMPRDPSVDMLTAHGTWIDEHQLRAYWVRWDQLMNGTNLPAGGKPAPARVPAEA